jgi:GntR family transcriptional regulator
MALQYGTTAITVRRALRMLEEEGLVRVEHGVGTFVADWARAYDLLHLPSFAREMAARDLRSETEVRGRRFGVRHPRGAAALDLAVDAPLAVLERLRRVEGLPLIFQRSYLPDALRGLVSAYHPDGSLYEMLREQTGRAPLSSEETIRAIPLAEDAARELGAEAGSVGWSASRTTSDTAGVALLYDEAYSAGNRVELRVRRRANQTFVEHAVIFDTDGRR